MTRTQDRDHALVIGAGISGLLAARALAPVFGRVTVVDGDDVAAGKAGRPGAVQTAHPHLMLARGGQALEELFPGLRDELAAAGAPFGDFGQTVRSRFPWGWAPQVTTGFTAQTYSRVALEAALRARVTAYSNVTLVNGFQVKGLRVHGVDASRVVGVTGDYAGPRPTPRPGEKLQHPDEMDYDLVVEASGRTTRLPRWLQETGFGTPDTLSVKCPLKYVSTMYEVPAHYARDWVGTIEATYPPDSTRGGAAVTVGPRHRLMSLIGHKDDMPTDPAELAAWAKTLRNDYLVELAAEGKAVSPSPSFLIRASDWRQYHRMRTWPNRLLAIGDSIASLNPVYGHGMTLAALQALLLRDMLDRHEDLSELTRRFQGRAARIIAAPWQLATSTDLGWDRDYRPNLPNRFMGWYIDTLFQAMLNRTRSYQAFCRVENMLASPAVLFHPAVVADVFGHALRRRRTSATTDDQVTAVIPMDQRER